MRRIESGLSIGIASIALTLAGASLAQEAEQDPYQELVSVFSNDTMRDRAFESIMQSAFVGTLEADPELRALEIECPGLVSGLSDAIRPIMRQSHNDGYVVYRQDLHTLFKSELSTEHAAQTAEFFGSDLGQRFFASVFSNQSMDNIIAEAMETQGEEDITVDAMRKDTNRTAIRALMALEPVDRKTIANVFANEEWAKAFAMMRAQMDALQADPKYQETTPEEDAAIEAASVTFAEAHFEACFAEE